jgi:hypothetical protein
MFINSYLIAVFSGVLIYLVMIIDSKYIEPNKCNEQLSPKIPLLVTLLVWIICTFQENEVIKQVPIINAINQEILTIPF